VRHADAEAKVARWVRGQDTIADVVQARAGGRLRSQVPRSRRPPSVEEGVSGPEEIDGRSGPLTSRRKDADPHGPQEREAK